MAVYQRITPLQSPFDPGVLDDKARVMVVCNYMATKTPSATLIEEVAKLLAGVGSLGVNIFGSSVASIPDGPGPYLSIRETGGTGPINDHNKPGTSYERPTIKVTVRAATYISARTMARAAYDALTAIVNQTVTP